MPATVTSRAAGDVLLDHLARVHPVHVVGAEDDDVLGLVVVDQVQRLVDGVGGALEPLRAEALLRGHRRDVVAEQRAHPPRRGDVPVEGVRLVLGQHHDAQVAGVHQVRQHEVDQAVVAPEGHGGLGPVRRQRGQPLPGTPREDDGEHTTTSHGRNLLGAASPVRTQPDPGWGSASPRCFARYIRESASASRVEGASPGRATTQPMLAPTRTGPALVRNSSANACSSRCRKDSSPARSRPPAPPGARRTRRRRASPRCPTSGTAAAAARRPRRAPRPPRRGRRCR